MAERRNKRTFEAQAIRAIRKGEKFLVSLPSKLRGNVAGYKDAAGRFHPIRWDVEYDPEEVDEPLYSTTHAGLPGQRKRSKKRRKR
jgi:hypothetical protein